MAQNSTIEWTDTTWNPTFGCSKVSEGCRNCYAEKMAHRLSAMGQPKYSHVTTNGKWNGQMSASDEVIFQPLKWKKPRRVFVNSMTDIFHENLSFDLGYHHKIFEVMLATPQHSYQLLTKRPARMREFLSNHEPWLRALKENRAGHVWLGTSVENQKAADERIPWLLNTPAVVRFLSCEPLLGAVDVLWALDGTACYECADWGEVDGEDCEHPHLDYAARRSWLDRAEGMARPTGAGLSEVGSVTIDWVIAGGESGPGARPMHPDWVRSLRDQCQAAGVPFFFKQWGGHEATAKDITTGNPVFKMYTSKQHWISKDWVHKGDICLSLDGKILTCGGDFDNCQYPVVIMRKADKKKAGRLLDGRTWDEMPEVKI